MAVTRPTKQQLLEIAEGFGMSLSETELSDFHRLMQATIDAYDAVDEMPDNLPLVKYPRTSGYRPGPDENKYNAWYWKCEIKGAPDGKLAGRTIAIKDNICVAGVPMMNGASTLEGYVPEIDATVVERILDAGGTITGKVVCEHFCLSGGSHTSDPLPVHNPLRMGYSAGGSSSGSGAVVAAGEADMALGGDQGGSIRMPAAYCGIVGLKPTHGLVPYTGIMPIEVTIDHTGPMTRTVADNALLLEVIAGEDGLDPRQYAPKVEPYTAALGQDVSGLRIGVVTEGFGYPQSIEAVDAKVRAGAEAFRGLGCTVEEVSIPMHRMGLAIWTPIALEGLTALMMEGDGFGTAWKGLYLPSLMKAHSGWRMRADELSDTLKISMFVGKYFLENYGGRYYAKSQNLVRSLKAAYDAELAKYDLLLMPTLPMTATKLPEKDAPLEEVISRAFEILPNTAPFDCTGHPAITMPCGLVDGLPAGLMLVAKSFDEATIYKAASAFESGVDWKEI